MPLSQAEKLFFYQQGYLTIPGAIAPDQVRKATQAINHTIGTQGIPPEMLDQFRARSYCPDLCKDDTITTLFNQSPVWHYAQSLVGFEKLQEVGAGQIALRFPRALFSDATDPKGHIDGIPSKHNGVGDAHRGFTGLAIVLLSDLPEANMGNFTFWPESHWDVQRHLQHAGIESLDEGMPNVNLSCKAEAFKGKAGDVILAHHNLWHTAMTNISPHIRYAAIFRFHHKDCQQNGNDCWIDMWREYEGLKDVVDSQGVA